jgi:hypothetical protein
MRFTVSDVRSLSIREVNFGVWRIGTKHVLVNYFLGVSLAVYGSEKLFSLTAQYRSNIQNKR